MFFIRAFLAFFASLTGLILALPILVVGLPFWFVAVFSRIISRLLEPKFVSWPQLIEFDSKIGWKPKANLDCYYLADRDDVYHIRTDSLGWPGQASISESEVVVFGDSYAFGYGIDSKASFANLNSDLRIKAIGAPGYNMVQELLIMRQLSTQLNNKLVIWFIFLENDLYDNIMPSMQSYRNPFVSKSNCRGSWEIVTSHLTPDKWNYTSVSRDNWPILAKLCTPCPLSQRVYSACNYLIKEGAEVCSEVGAQLVVLTIPALMQLYHEVPKFLGSIEIDKKRYDSDYPDKMITRICKKHKIHFLASKDCLSIDDYKRFEKGHWNENGHLQIAKLIASLYKSYL